MYDHKRKILLFLLIITLLFSLFTVYIYSSGGLSVSAKSALLYSPETDTVLYSKSPHKRMAMASTTKIMSAIIAIENGNLDSTVLVDDAAVGVEGSSIYIEKGESFKMLDLIYAMMLQSANDAASAIALHISGSIEGFAELMNQKCIELGLKNTNFTNPHGLDSKYHYTSAYDLGMITAYALKNPIFKEIVSTYKKEIESSSKTRLLVNHNKLLKLCEGSIGVKTGFTKKSGRSLVGACMRDDTMLISVTINAPDDWNDHRQMFDYGFSMLERQSLASIGQYSYRIPVLNSEDKFLNIRNTEELSVLTVKDGSTIKTQILLPKYLVAPIKSGDTVGYVVFLRKDKEIGRIELISEKDVEEEKKAFPFL